MQPQEAATLDSATSSTTRTVGVVIIGFGGAVSTTAIAGVHLMRAGLRDRAGLPLASLPPEAVRGELVDYENLVFAGWDFDGRDLATACREHGVLDAAEVDACATTLGTLPVWPAIDGPDFDPQLASRPTPHRRSLPSHRERIAAIRHDLDAFASSSGADRTVVINLASTERLQRNAAPLETVGAFEKAVDDNDARIGPAMLHAYAAIEGGYPYANFTPSQAADCPALRILAAQRGVAIAGKDGKTGQTLLKTVLAPALHARGLRIDGWYSTNILGNRDGEALSNPDSLASKVGTKESVLDQILGYEVEDHIVQISYYRPRGDDKESWDNIDVSGFLGKRMQLKVNFLCKDSVLAAPLVLEIARCLDLAQARGQGGVIEELGAFFKAPMTSDGRPPAHDFAEQQRRLALWLRG